LREMPLFKKQIYGGMKMDKMSLLRHCGNLEQVASVRPVTYADGRANGMKAILVKNGKLEFSLLQDKCLDIGPLSYGGINMTLMSKPGLQGRNPYDTHGEESVRSIMGGAMFTCGFENIHVPRIVDGVEYPMHGRMRTTPMEKVAMDACFEGEDYVMEVCGEGREAALFGENLILRRQVRTVYGESTLEIVDEIENRTFKEDKLCFLYHFNSGFPFLEGGCRVLIPHVECIPRNADAEKGLGRQFVMDDPVDNAPEQVFLYVPKADENGNTFAAVVNDRLGLAMCIRWNVKEIPYITQWKTIASGDYAMALEPCNANFEGREDPNAQVLPPLGKHVNHYSLSILDGKDAIAALDAEFAQLTK